MPGREATYYELLEIPPRASREEVQVAYNRARAAFAQNSLAVYSLFSADECRDLQQRIEEAYRTLMNEEARRRYDETIGLGAGAARPAMPSRPAPPGPPPRPASVPARTERPLQATLRPAPEGRASEAPPGASPPRPPATEAGAAVIGAAQDARRLPASEAPPAAPTSAETIVGGPQDPRRFAPPGDTSASRTTGDAVTGGPQDARRLPASEATSASPAAVVTGALLRRVRERQGISLRDISQTTKVSLAYLQFIEEENFQQLPVPAYLRGFLKAYAKCVGLDPDRVSSEYVKLYSLYHEIKSER